MAEEFVPTFRRQSEEDMVKEVTENATRRLRALEADLPKPTKLPGVWAPSELWPGEDYMHVNNAYTDYRLT